MSADISAPEGAGSTGSAPFLFLGQGGAFKAEKIVACAPNQVLLANITDARESGLPFLSMPDGMAEPHIGRVALVGAGPSLERRIEKLKTFDGLIIAADSVWLKLYRSGIRGFTVISMDPKPLIADFYKAAPGDLQYWIASCCDPSVRAVLKGRDLTLYHAICQSGEDYREGETWFGHMTTQVSAAMMICYQRGYREFHCFGMDCAYERKDGAFYADDIPVDAPDGKDAVTFDLGGRVFTTVPPLFAQAERLTHFMLRAQGCRFVMHGDGLLAWNLRLAEHVRPKIDLL